MIAKREVRHPLAEGVTLAALVRPGMKICLVFPHGLGDVVMFLPVLHKVRRTWPGTLFHLMTKKGLEELQDADESIEYDLAFHLDYYMTTASTDDTKTTLCCKYELGIEPPLDEMPIAPKGFRSPWVGIGCTSLCNGAMWAPSAYETKELNDGVVEAGFIPVDLAMACYGRPFEERSPMACDLRRIPGTYAKLAGVIERCYAFIGTFTGSYHVAQALLPGRNLLLCPRAGEWRRLYRRAPVHINMRDITKARIKEWLLSLPET